MKKELTTWSRALAATVATVYFFSNVVLAYTPENNIWAERHRHIEKSNAHQKGQQDNLLLASLPTTASSMTLFRSLPPFSKSTSALSNELAKSLPAGFVAKHTELFNALLTTHGTIRKVSLPIKNAGDRVVVLMQDVHQNEVAQRHMGGAIDAVVQARQADLVALEGAFAPIDVKPFHDFEDREVIGLTADYLLKNNLITGPVHAFMTTKAALPPLVGVDDKTHYDANVEAYRQSAPKKDTFKNEIAARKTKLELHKKSVYSKDLGTFDALVGAYKERQVSLADYVEALAPAKGVGQAGLLAQAFKMEKALDFDQVEQDRKDMMDVLVNNISKTQTDRLIQESVGYRTGGVRYGEFYRYLQSLCRSVKVDLSRFPHMDAYIRYVLLSDQMDGEKLMEELAALEKDRYTKLAKTPEEKYLVAQSHALHLTDRLLNFALTPTEWKEYRALNSAGFPSFEAFYRNAQLRDEDIAENLLSSMNKINAARAILVTGGFHTEGISKRLRAAGVSVITFTPRIEKIDTDNNSTYLSVFTQEKTPLEKLFTGEKLFVTQHPCSEIAKETGAIIGVSQVVGKTANPRFAPSFFRRLGGSVQAIVTAKIHKGVVEILYVLTKGKNGVKVVVTKVAGSLFVDQKRVGVKKHFALSTLIGKITEMLLTRKIQSTNPFRPQGLNFLVQDPVDGRPVPTGESRLITEVLPFALLFSIFRWNHKMNLNSLALLAILITTACVPGGINRPGGSPFKIIGITGEPAFEDIGEALERRVREGFLIPNNEKNKVVYLLVNSKMPFKTELEFVDGNGIPFYESITLHLPNTRGNVQSYSIDLKGAHIPSGTTFFKVFYNNRRLKKSVMFDLNRTKEATPLPQNTDGSFGLPESSSPVVSPRSGTNGNSNLSDVRDIMRGIGLFLIPGLALASGDPSQLVGWGAMGIVLLTYFVIVELVAVKGKGPSSFRILFPKGNALVKLLKTVVSAFSYAAKPASGAQEMRLAPGNPEEDAKSFIEAINNPSGLLKALTPHSGRVTGFDGSPDERRSPRLDFVRNVIFWVYQSKNIAYTEAFRAAVAKEMEQYPELKGNLQVMTILNTLLGGVTSGVPLAGDHSKLTVVEATVNNPAELGRLVQTAEAIQAANALIEEQGGQGIRLALTPSESVSAERIREELRNRKVDVTLFDVKDGPANKKIFSLQEYVAASEKTFAHFNAEPASVNLRYLNAPNIRGLTSDILHEMKGADDQLKKLLAESLLTWMRGGDRWFSVETFNELLKAVIVFVRNA